MWETWKRAWHEAVENFRREAANPDAVPGRRSTMQRELDAARAELRRLEDDIARTRRQLVEEREAMERCRRQQALARDIGDDETATIAARYAERHAERARVLAAKLDALEAELALRTDDVREMETILQAAEPPTAASHFDLAEEDDEVFHRLDRDARERQAEERLEELKRKMRG